METNTFKSKHTEFFEGEYNIYLPNENENLPVQENARPGLPHRRL